VCTAPHRKTFSELQSFTCHIGSCSDTCCPTQANAPQL